MSEGFKSKVATKKQVQAILEAAKHPVVTGQDMDLPPDERRNASPNPSFSHRFDNKVVIRRNMKRGEESKAYWAGNSAEQFVLHAYVVDGEVLLEESFRGAAFYGNHDYKQKAYYGRQSKALHDKADAVAKELQQVLAAEGLDSVPDQSAVKAAIIEQEVDTLGYFKSRLQSTLTYAPGPNAHPNVNEVTLESWRRALETVVNSVDATQDVLLAEMKLLKGKDSDGQEG